MAGARLGSLRRHRRAEGRTSCPGKRVRCLVSRGSWAGAWAGHGADWRPAHDLLQVMHFQVRGEFLWPLDDGNRMLEEHR